ncbi:protein-tyrosine phosphatase-like protein [Pholiota molesta]|nr:protein-tyrosine phosphatase-like protein [Pholiota molesta]
MVSHYKTLTVSRPAPNAAASSSSSSTPTSRKQDLPPSKPKRKLQALYPAAAPRPLTAARARPIPNSYWATPLLLACEYPWSPQTPTNPKLDALLLAGVRTFIDLTECGELLPYTSILATRAGLLGVDPAALEYHRFPIRDRCLPASPALMDAVLGTLRDAAARGRVCAVHCRGGIGRTGVVVGCWLVESGAARDGREALALIAREWQSVEKCTRYPHSPETGPQFEFVARFRRAPRGSAAMQRGLQVEVA